MRCFIQVYGYSKFIVSINILFFIVSFHFRSTSQVGPKLQKCLNNLKSQNQSTNIYVIVCSSLQLILFHVFVMKINYGFIFMSDKYFMIVLGCIVGQNNTKRRKCCLGLQEHEHKVLLLGRWQRLEVSFLSTACRYVLRSSNPPPSTTL